MVGGVGVSVSVREVEVCGRGGGVWEGWRCVGEVKVCERGGEVWWEGWRCVGGVEVSIGGVEMCGKE